MTKMPEKAQRNPYTTPRYFVFSLLATALLVVGLLGFMSDKGDFGSLLGDYREMVHANWHYSIMSGLVVGMSNLLIAFSNR